MKLIEKVRQEYESLYLQARRKDKLEKETDYLYFPKIQLTDEDISYLGYRGKSIKKYPYWYDFFLW